MKEKLCLSNNDNVSRCSISCAIIIFGYPLRKNLFHVVNAHPDIVLVDISSNDMCDEEVTPAKLAGDIMKLARFFVEGCDVKVMVIGALLPRRNPNLAVGYNPSFS